MFTKLDLKTRELLCCPICKGDLIFETPIVCNTCNAKFPNITLKTGNGELESVLDFRLNYPIFAQPPNIKEWVKAQNDYISFSNKIALADNYENYLSEIESVKEIYTTVFPLSDNILDVGGHQGRLRHFLEKNVNYVNCDPYPQIIENIGLQKNLLKAYPCLLQPCNFVASFAEFLPFKKNSFNFIHMRSCLDHFIDPYMALREGFRVLKNNGELIIGLSIMEKLEELNVVGKSNINMIIIQIMNLFIKNDDHHIFRFTRSNLQDLLGEIGFYITKEHWQKPPFNYCLYITAKKIDINKAENQ